MCLSLVFRRFACPFRLRFFRNIVILLSFVSELMAFSSSLVMLLCGGFADLSIPAILFRSSAFFPLVLDLLAGQFRDLRLLLLEFFSLTP